MTNAFDRISFDAPPAPELNAFDRVFLKDENKPLNAFDRISSTITPSEYSPTAAIQNIFAEYKQLKDKYPNLTMGDINLLLVRKEKGDEVGAKEALGDIPLGSYVPGMEARKAVLAWTAMKRIESGGYAEETGLDFQDPSSAFGFRPVSEYTTKQTEARNQDLKTVGKYMREIELSVAKEELLGLTTGAKISSGAARTLPYILDFVITHGVASGVKQASIETAERLLGKAVGKHVATRAAATTLAAGARTFAQPGTYDEYLKKILPHTTIDENGDLEVLQKGQAPLNAALETWAERTVGNLAEVSGSAIMGGAKKIVGKTIGKLPPGKLVMRAIEKLHKRIFPKATQREVAKKAFNVVGIQGLPEEWAEERFEGAMRQVLGLPGGGLLPASGEEALVELGILGIFGGIRTASMMPFAFQPEAGSPQEAIKKLKNTKKLIDKSPEIKDSKKGEIQADLDRRIQQLSELAEMTSREQELEEHLHVIKGEQIEAPLTARPQITAEYQQRIDDLEEQRMVVRSAENLTEEQKRVEYEALDNEIFSINRRIQDEQKPIEQGDVAPTTPASRTDPEHVARIEQELTFLRERRTEQQRVAQEEYDAIIAERSADTSSLIRNQPRIGSEAIISEGQLLPTIEGHVPEQAVLGEGQMLETPALQHRPGPTSTVPRGIEGSVLPKEPKIGHITTLGAAFTSMPYYQTLLGVDKLTDPALRAKLDLGVEYHKLSNEIDIIIAVLNKDAGISRRERRRYYKKGKPTTAMVKMAEALNTHENPPVTFNEIEIKTFQYFRGLSRTLIERENLVRDSLGMERISYRTAYFRHIAERTVDEIDEGVVELPEELQYWMTQQVNAKLYNPTEFKRKLGSKLEEFYSRDLGAVSKSMAWLALKEIHLSEPLATFKEQLALVAKDIPSRTREHLEEYIDVCIKGQESTTDKDINAHITHTSLGKMLNFFLKPFAKKISSRPMTNFGRKVGKLNILAALWGRPDAVIRNWFQRIMEMGLYNTRSSLKAYVPATKQMNSIMASSAIWRGYSGIEEVNLSGVKKLERFGMMPYQAMAQRNFTHAMKTAYHATLKYFVDPKFAKFGRADPARTYTEPEGFLYESEKLKILREMEFGAGATQFLYMGPAMPGIFKHKATKPLTSLQSWWMNYLFMFNRECLIRLFTGKTGYGASLCWADRLGYARDGMLGCPILNILGYSASVLSNVLPTRLAPTAALSWALYRWLLADDDKERKRYGRDVERNLKIFIPGSLAVEKGVDILDGNKPPEALFLYNTQDDDGATLDRLLYGK